MINIDNIINSKIVSDPWEYKIVDNFFTDESFYHLEKAANQLEQFAEEKESLHFYPYDFEKCGLDPIVSEIFISATNNLLKNVDKITNGFSKHGESHQGYFALPHFAVTGTNFKFNIHTDSSNRVLTAVTYISPGLHRGTMLYQNSTEDSYVKDIEWKQNRSFVTCPVDNKDTWHNWENYGSKVRVSINLSCQKIENLHDAIDSTADEYKSDLVSWFFTEINQGNLIVNL